MSKIKVKPFQGSDSEDSGSDISEVIEKSDADSEAEQFEIDGFASSTHIEPKSSKANGKQKDDKNALDIKLKITAALRKQKFAAFRHTTAVKKISWEDLGLDEFSKEELEEHFHQIMKSAGTIRTLDEVLADYEKNCVRYSIHSHPDHPTRPTSASMRYVLDNRDKLTQQLEKQLGKAVNYNEVFKFGMEKFKNLPDKKKNSYIEQARVLGEEYVKKKANFMKNHPELKRKIIIDSSKAKAKPKPKNDGPMTPFSFYREQISKEGNFLNFTVVQRMWKNLPIEEKGKYILELVNLKTDRPKKILPAERKYMDAYSGLPPRPLSAYNLFGQNFRTTYNGDMRNYIVNQAAAWKKIDKSEKLRLQNESDELTKKWREDMLAYIQKLPEEHQPFMYSKYNLFKPEKTESKRKAKSERTINDSLPNKKIKLSEDSDSVAETVSRKNKISESSFSSKEKSPEKSPKKMEKSVKSIEKSPKKSQKKAPEYPSQSTAHYFMTKVYEGKPHKVQKAYKKLSRSQKQVYRKSMDINRNNYLLLTKEYLKELSEAELAMFQLKAKAEKQKQQDDIAWHVDTGTDEEEGNSSGSDSSDSS